MDVVIRAVNERFLEEVVFPVFELGRVDSGAALIRLRDVVDDPEVHTQVEALLDRQAEGGWGDVEVDRFQEIVYRLLFQEWRKDAAGWTTSAHSEAFAGPLEQTVHFALMLTDPLYPYWDAAEAQRHRAALLEPPYLERGLPAFISGIWERAPSFAPGEVLTTRGTNIYRPNEDVALADWAWRSREAVQEWSSELPRALRALMQREVERLRPIDIPEASEVVDFWLGRSKSPPQLVVAFSGLGSTSTQWVREIADLASQIRRAASREQGLTAIITGGHRSWF